MQQNRDGYAFLVDLAIVTFPAIFCIALLLTAPTAPEAWAIIALVASAAGVMLWARIRVRRRLTRDLTNGQLHAVSGPVALDWVRTGASMTVGKGRYQWYRLTLHDGRRIGISESLLQQLLRIGHPVAASGAIGQLAESGPTYRIDHLTVFVLPESAHIVAIHDHDDHEIYREPLFRGIALDL